MPRFRSLGGAIGSMAVGASNSILDVPGVGVGHATVWRDEPEPPAGRGVARTGITVIDPGGDCFLEPIPFGATALNGAGEMTGYLTTKEWGLLEAPIFLTSTMQVGRVYDAACRLLMAENPRIGAEEVVIPVVAECDDSFLNESRAMQVDENDVAAALEQARASAQRPREEQNPPEEGAVGSGTGMACLGFKGGIGSSSRVIDSGETVGVLVMTNFGDFSRLTIDGVLAGQLMPDPATGSGPGTGRQRRRGPDQEGSCIVVVGTDAALDHSACERVARRAGLGLARTGSTAHHGSGEIFMAFATGARQPRGNGWATGTLVGRRLDPFFEAVVDATEEAVLNSMLMAPTVVGRNGNTLTGLSSEVVGRLLQRRG